VEYASAELYFADNSRWLADKTRLQSRLDQLEREHADGGFKAHLERTLGKR
jgi:hypothetical protein